MLYLMITSISIYGEEEKGVKLIQQLTPITCANITFGEDYSFQLKIDLLGESTSIQWEYFHGNMPRGLGLDFSGKLSGRLGGTQKECEGKTFIFWVKARDNDNPSTAYIFEVHLRVNKITAETKEKKIYWKSTEQIRLIAGYEMIKPSGGDIQGNGFVDLYLSQNFPGWENDFWNRLMIWGNVRLSSVPIKGSKLGDISNSDYFKDLRNFTLEEIAQAGEFLLGLEFHLGEKIIEAENLKFTIGFTLSMGAIAPAFPSDNAVSYKEIPSEYQDRYDGKKCLALVKPSYNRFYRQYYVGLRLKTYNLKEDNLPGVFDLMLGMNAATSGGRNKFLKRLVFRLDGFLPLNLIKDGMIYVFGSIVLNTTKRSLVPFQIGDTASLDLTKVNISPSDIAVRILPENDLDYYRIGLGIEFTKIFASKK